LNSKPEGACTIPVPACILEPVMQPR